MRHIIPLLMVGAMLLSCGTPKHPGLARCERYVQWFEDPANGMTQTIVHDKTTLACRLSNSSYEELSRSVSEATCADALKQLKKTRKEQDMLSFIVKINDESGILKEQIIRHPAVITYMQQDIRSDFLVVHATDTIEPVFCHFENRLDVAPQVSFIIGIRSPANLAGDLTLLFNDRFITRHAHAFVFQSSNIKRIPKL